MELPLSWFNDPIHSEKSRKIPFIKQELNAAWWSDHIIILKGVGNTPHSAEILHYFEVWKSKFVSVQVIQLKYYYEFYVKV